jgi:hypothetical protein
MSGRGQRELRADMTIRLYAYLAAALAIIGLAWYEIGVHKKAGERDAFKQKYEKSEAQRREDVKQYELGLAESQAQREKLQKGLQVITDRFNRIQIPPAKTLIKTVEVPGACSRVGVSESFVSVWDAAASP